jgi:hypothetical protein
VLLAASSLEGSVPPLKLQPLADVPLGGKTTRLDYASLDLRRHLLFIAHLGDGAVIVFDTKTQQVSRRIAGISKVHGVLAVPELDTVYASATGTDEIVAIDGGTLEVSAHVAAVDPATHRGFLPLRNVGGQPVLRVMSPGA